MFLGSKHENDEDEQERAESLDEESLNVGDVVRQVIDDHEWSWKHGFHEC